MSVHTRIFVEVDGGMVEGVYIQNHAWRVDQHPEVVIIDWDLTEEDAREACEKFEELKPTLTLLKEVLL